MGFYGGCKNKTLVITKKKDCIQNLSESVLSVVLELRGPDLMYLLLLLRETTCLLLLSGKLPNCVHGKCTSPIKQAFCFFKRQNGYKSRMYSANV